MGGFHAGSDLYFGQIIASGISNRTQLHDRKNDVLSYFQILHLLVLAAGAEFFAHDGMFVTQKH